MSEKSVDAFRTISEVADDLKLPQHVLRFWETRFNQIKPMKRGGGRRYYKPDDVELLRGIRYLLYVKGFTIKGVQRILKENGPRFVVAVGSGDTEALEAMQAGRQASSSQPNEGPHFGDLDLIAADGLETGADDGAHEADVEASDPAITTNGSVSSTDPIDRQNAEPQVSDARRPLAGFLKRHREPTVDAPGDRTLSRESIEALDTVILELLECKRLLDQVR